MKKITTAALLLFGLSFVQAQVTFRPGIRAGVNFSHLTESDDNRRIEYDPETNLNYREGTQFDSQTSFYVGLYGALQLTRFYTLQPELNYTRQGAEAKILDYNTFTHAYTTYRQNIELSYLSIGVMNKFTFSGLNIHVGPSIDIIVDKSQDDLFSGSQTFDPDFGYTYNSNYLTTDSEVDLALTLGIGYNFTKNLGIEARVKQGLVPVFDFWDDGNRNVVFSAGLTYTFNISAEDPKQ